MNRKWDWKRHGGRKKLKLYIAYGSNMNIEQMMERCPKSQAYGKYELEDYKLAFKGQGHANLEKSNGGKLPILIWKITQECEKSLDKYESYPDYYLKKDMVIEIDGKVLKALVYVMNRDMAAIVKEPSEEYFNIIRQGYIDNNADPKILDDFYNEHRQAISKEELEE